MGVLHAGVNNLSSRLKQRIEALAASAAETAAIPQALSFSYAAMPLVSCKRRDDAATQA